MRRTLKFLHEIGSCGMIGALAAHMVLVVMARGLGPSEYLLMRRGIEAISKYVLLPSMLVTVVSGLFAIAATRAFHDAGWVWLKAVTGVALVEGTLGAVQGTARRTTELAVKILEGQSDPSAMRDVMRHEWGGLGVVMFLSVFNVLIAVWRPRLSRRARRKPMQPEPAKPEAEAGPAAG